MPPPVHGQRRPGSGDEEVRYYRSSSYDEPRADTPQSGRLSQAELSAMIVREKWEDGTFDTEIAVDRKGLHRGYKVQSISKLNKLRKSSENFGKIRDPYPVSYTHLTLPTNREV